MVSAVGLTKRDAQIQCALMACERLEAAGLLRDVLTRSKRKTYAENDYYDSDEDTFLDRTGQIEEQRKKRILRYEVYFLREGT